MYYCCLESYRSITEHYLLVPVDDAGTFNHRNNIRHQGRNPIKRLIRKISVTIMLLLCLVKHRRCVEQYFWLEVDQSLNSTAVDKTVR